jgi:hypothetical protein
MEIKTMKALWGMSGTLESQFERIAAAGYDGIESAMPAAEQEEQFRKLLDQYKLSYIAMVFTQGPDHAASFETQLRRAATFQPVSITAHSAKDSMPPEEQVAYFRRAAAAEREYGIPVGHETHRGRAMFNPWNTAHLLQQVPELKLTADFSHWCCVCESMLNDQEQHLALAITRTAHIHARVGYAQGPQVPDPRAPEYASELERHFAWWERIAAEHRSRGAATLTVTPEYGPPAYMHTLPFTNQPVTDLWDVCKWTADVFKSRIKG